MVQAEEAEKAKQARLLEALRMAEEVKAKKEAMRREVGFRESSAIICCFISSEYSFFWDDSVISKPIFVNNSSDQSFLMQSNVK